MKIPCSVPAFLVVLLISCSPPEKQPTENLFQKVSDLAFIEGKEQYLASPFVTAGDRVYIIGHQDGTFPDLGWHVAGEMGGIWDHPIKLMDGFSASLKLKGVDKSFCLDKAEKFTNYPIANSHYYNWAEENITVDRIQSVPDGVEGVIVEFRIKNNSKENKEINFSFLGMIDLRPTWLGERTDMIDAADSVSFHSDLSAVMAKDKNNPWFVMYGSSMKAQFTNDTISCPPPVRKGLGKNAELSWSNTLKPNEEIIIPIFIAGSYQSEETLRNTYALLTRQGHEKIKQKKDRYEILNSTAQLSVPDKEVEQMYEWLKYNTDWLTRYVPEQGAGLSAGLPDYPWWFGTDATYALQGALATGNHELARNTILLLQQISQRTNKNGRIIHEVSTNGAVFNQGNVNETAQFITLVNNYYKWTGDEELVRQLFPELKKGMQWLLGEKDPDGNHYPNGSGMMEIPGLESKLEMIDVAAYTQQAMVSYSELASALGDSTDAANYRKLAEEVKVKINEEWWQPNENSFGDFIGTVEQATPILEAALVRTDTLGKTWAVEELKNTQKKMKKYKKGKPMPHVIYHNWVVNTPLETGIADSAKAQIARAKAKTYENAYGVFVTGIDRTEEADSVVLKSRKKIFSYTGAVMTLPTSVQAVAAARYGDMEDALQYIKKLHRSFSYALPGSMYEVSPDFGMITQAWNIYGVAVPIVQYFFGFSPRAYEKSLYLSPDLPAEWKDAALENVKVGNNYISLSVSQKNDHKEYHIRQLLEDWKIFVDVSKANKIMVNDKEVDLTTLVDHQLTLKGKENKVLIY
jgi:glycogen debranching enzyme